MLPSVNNWLHGPLRVEKLEHPPGRVDGDRTRANRLPPEIHQSGVVADVSVGEKDAVGRPSAGQGMDLRVEIGRRVEQIGPAADAIDHPHARHPLCAPLAASDGHAERLLAVEMGNARVLRDAKHDQTPIGRLREWLQRKQRDDGDGRRDSSGAAGAAGTAGAESAEAASSVKSASGIEHPARPQHSERTARHLRHLSTCGTRRRCSRYVATGSEIACTT